MGRKANKRILILDFMLCFANWYLRNGDKIEHSLSPYPVVAELLETPVFFTFLKSISTQFFPLKPTFFQFRNRQIKTTDIVLSSH